METIYLNSEKLNIDKPICSAVGFFDGIHIGHMVLINEVIRVSKEKGYKKALITFDHSPAFVLGYFKEERCLTSMEDRQKILEELGFDYLFIIAFNKDVAALSPQDFISYYLLNANIKHVVCGFDFRFGSHNLGDVKTLNACHEFETSIIDEVMYKGEKISSTRIRQILADGQIDDMNELLGRYYTVHGEVVKGRQIGHSIGFPTANVDYQSYFLPCNGVYAVKVKVNQIDYIGMCNIGFNPTFTALDKPSLEVYIFDFDDDIYGEDISIEFHYFIRKEKAFASKAELIVQLQTDKDYINDYFKK